MLDVGGARAGGAELRFAFFVCPDCGCMDWFWFLVVAGFCCFVCCGVVFVLGSVNLMGLTILGVSLTAFIVCLRADCNKVLRPARGKNKSGSVQAGPQDLCGLAPRGLKQKKYFSVILLGEGKFGRIFDDFVLWLFGLLFSCLVLVCGFLFM